MSGDRRRRVRAAWRTLLFLLVAPGVMAGVIPWLLTGWDAHDPPGLWARIVGGGLVVAGGVALLEAFVRFVLEGIGTPAPVAPTEHLVVGGLYRYVRNPMYIAVEAMIVGQALLLWRAVLLVYAVLFGLGVWAFVHWYEEPTLARQFGDRYESYRRAVPGWWPRRTPWDGDSG